MVVYVPPEAPVPEACVDAYLGHAWGRHYLPLARHTVIPGRTLVLHTGIRGGGTWGGRGRRVFFIRVGGRGFRGKDGVVVVATSFYSAFFYVSLPVVIFFTWSFACLLAGRSYNQLFPPYRKIIILL